MITDSSDTAVMRPELALQGVHHRLQLDIPETDYRRLHTLADIVEYSGQPTARS